MPWDPEKYNQFKSIRYQPFFDLMELISAEGLEKCVDIGCGTGEQTKLLSEKFDKAFFLGIDPSPEMLAKAKEVESSDLSFKNSTVEDFIASDEKGRWDLVFSNAALQWSNNHQVLFPQLISLLSEKGQFAVQMPVQNENLLNKILLELVQEEPFKKFLKGWKRESPVLSMDQYAQIMFENRLNNIQIMQKVYPIIADNPEKLYDFISGTTLMPYLDRLSESEQKLFVTEFKIRIEKALQRFPAIYAFKRVLLYGSKIKRP